MVGSKDSIEAWRNSPNGFIYHVSLFPYGDYGRKCVIVSNYGNSEKMLWISGPDPMDLLIRGNRLSWLWPSRRVTSGPSPGLACWA